MDRTYPAGVTSWVDVNTPDPAAAQAFYGELFGWGFDVGSNYSIARLGDHPVAGIGGGTTSSAAWNTYVAVDDAAATTARAEVLGGRVVAASRDTGEPGISAALADPSGVEFRLWQAGTLLGAQAANEPGAWNFSVLHTDDPGVSAFYVDLFGWEFADIGYGVLIRQPGYGDHLAATVDPTIYERQAGVSPVGFADAIGWQAPTSPAIPASWHVAFTVADRDTTAATAERLGATVVAASDTEWTHDAVIRDPQGALFTASQFDPQV